MCSDSVFLSDEHRFPGFNQGEIQSINTNLHNFKTHVASAEPGELATAKQDLADAAYLIPRANTRVQQAQQQGQQNPAPQPQGGIGGFFPEIVAILAVVGFPGCIPSPGPDLASESTFKSTQAPVILIID